MQVGREARARIGTACYDRGGTQPTVTDANLLLGYLNPSALCGGELAIDYSRPRPRSAIWAGKWA